MVEKICDFSGKILGTLEDKGTEIVACNFYGKILGYYDKERNITTEFSGRIICTGNGLAGLIMKDAQ